MAKRIGKHLRGNVVAYIALFLALGMGTAYALDRNSVRSKHIADGQVKSVDVRNNSLTGSDVNEAKLDGTSVGRFTPPGEVCDPPAEAVVCATVNIRLQRRSKVLVIGDGRGQGPADYVAGCQLTIDDAGISNGAFVSGAGEIFSIVGITRTLAPGLHTADLICAYASGPGAAQITATHLAAVSLSAR